MILVVIGPTDTRFARLVTNMVSNGVNTCSLFSGSSTPERLDGRKAVAVLSPGYVKARMTGRAVCIEK